MTVSSKDSPTLTLARGTRRLQERATPPAISKVLGSQKHVASLEGDRQLRLTIGVMGGAGPMMTNRNLRVAYALGEAIAKRNCILITGACPGLPLAAADGAAAAGGLVVGISPALSLDEHVRMYHSPVEGHDMLVFTGSGLMGREVVNIRSSDIIVIIGGRSGTLGELAIAYDEGKLIGVITGTGGITAIIPRIIRACRKNTGARILYDAQPARLVDRLMRTFSADHYRRPSCHMADAAVPSGARTARDPVCGMWLDPRRAPARVLHQRTPYWFCCDACARKFRQEPAVYISDAPMKRNRTSRDLRVKLP